MRVYWMFLILMGCRLSPTTELSCTYKDKLISVCVPEGANVSVPCPKNPGRGVNFHLFRNEETIYNYTCIVEGNEQNCKSHTMVGVELHGNTENQSISFMLTGVNATSHGIYRCEGSFTFPPPYTVERDRGILVLVEGHQCNKECKSSEPDRGQRWGFHWIWITALVAIYSLTVTIIATVLWVKLRKTESQSDYMNTKPKAPRDRRRKRGVQIPIPRHF